MASKYPSSPTEPRKFTVRAQHSGIIHAIVCYFDLFVDKGRKHVVSTHPGVASRNRDMAWGQQVQSVRNTNESCRHLIFFFLKICANAQKLSTKTFLQEHERRLARF